MNGAIDCTLAAGVERGNDSISDQLGGQSGARRSRRRTGTRDCKDIVKRQLTANDLGECGEAANEILDFWRLPRFVAQQVFAVNQIDDKFVRKGRKYLQVVLDRH